MRSSTSGARNVTSVSSTSRSVAGYWRQSTYAETGVGDVRRLTGVREPEYRLRVRGWRVRFALTDDTPTMIVLRVLPCVRAYSDA